MVSTRHYRAPEIILGKYRCLYHKIPRVQGSIFAGLGWSYPCDAFSLGCILVEFYTGVALFQTHDNLEHLAMMEQVMGKMPESFARSGARHKPEYFKDGSKLDWPKPKATRQSRKEVKACRALSVSPDLMSLNISVGSFSWQDIIPPSDNINKQFFDLVKKLLIFDPAHRITVKDALQHPYFSTHIAEES